MTKAKAVHGSFKKITSSEKWLKMTGTGGQPAASPPDRMTSTQVCVTCGLLESAG
jgi:hypothetical protein